ncbi:MAG TPA: class I SAM-dependent methyltransferase [Chryseolinea sp.]|nr:class I SAM-dependent methyltransferase [Chryseolinea sp.]
MIDRILTGVMQRIMNLVLSRGSENYLLRMINMHSNALSIMARRSIELTKDNPMASKPILIGLLELESAIDRAVNQLANHYYEGKHPKHYLWISHNDFVVDNIKPGERVIDIGCGASQYTLRLAEKGAAVLGVDKNPELIKRILANNVHPNLKYIAMDLSKELPQKKFDVAVCSHVLEHLEDPVAFLKRLRCITSRVIIKVPRVDSGWKKLMKKDLGMFWLDDADHRKEYTWDILLWELDQSGYVPVKKETGLDLRVVAECN